MNKHKPCSHGIPALRPTNFRRAANGETFDITSDYWEVSATGSVATFNFEWCTEVLSPLMKNALKEVVAYRLETNLASSILAELTAFKRPCVWLRRENNDLVGWINRKDIAAYRLGDPSGSDYSMRNIVSSWQEIGFPGIAPDAAELIDGFRKKENEKVHILTLDPESGPYLDGEIAMVDRELHEAYENGAINDAQYVLVQTFRLYGQRASMNANLKLRDIRTPKHHGVETSIRFEILKQKRTQAERYGPKRPAPMLFTHALEAYLDRLTGGIPAPEWNQEKPLFPARTDEFVTDCRSVNKKRARRSKGQTKAGYEGHMTANLASERFKAILGRLNIISPRTGEPMVFNQMRERHTIATIMAMRGCTAEEIAAWMHHTSPGSCEAYIELASRHHQLMSSLLDGKMVHVAGRFLGQVTEAQPDDLEFGAIITATEADGAPDLGACDSGGCSALESLAAPYACFLCRHFNLSIDSDLDPLLHLLTGRKAEAKMHGDDEYSRELNRHVAAVLAAKKMQHQARNERESTN
ncbi:hypothetical protein RUESEDTHA_02198 [Ruegeria sp. THAF57]|uniref:site-specific integrase n=1 Tax=Ruegeria TaxID=97050 RepID=UPI00147ADF9C|nr:MULTISPECIES: site-specific integrase [Ruegeria]CAD0185312.1 hypothetical protein RUESEDTHA_02198 [Ruegeria sp. THAF57]